MQFMFSSSIFSCKDKIMSSSSSSVNSAHQSCKRKQSESFAANSDSDSKKHSHLHESPCKSTKMVEISSFCGSIGGIYNVQTSDFAFIFNENGHKQAIPAHKCILASDSSVFYQLFFDTPQSLDHLSISGASIDKFSIFLSSFYGTSMKLKRHDVADIMRLAYKYDAIKCKEVCRHFLLKTIETGVDDILWALQLANIFGCDEVQEICIGKVRNFGAYLIETGDFRDCNRNTLKMILNIDFVGRDEIKVLEACIDWARNIGVDQSDGSKEEADNRIESMECVERDGMVEGVQNVEMIDYTKKTELKVETRAQAIEIMGNVENVNSTQSNEAKRSEVIRDFHPKKDKESKSHVENSMPLKRIRQMLGDCFELIRFHAMTERDFILCLSKYVEMFNRIEVKEISAAIVGIEGKTIDRHSPLAFNSVPRGRLVALSHRFKAPFAVFSTIFNDRKSADVNFICTDEENGNQVRWSAHKCILAIKSPIFADLAIRSEKTAVEIQIDSITATEFGAFLRLLYGYPLIGIASLENVEKILTLAHEYHINDILKGHESKFKRFVVLENLFWALNLTDKFGYIDWANFNIEWIQRYCYRMDLNFAFVPNALVHCSESVVKSALALDFPNRNESMIFDAVINWAKNQCTLTQTDPNIDENLRNAVNSVFGLIKFGNMSLDQFNAKRTKYPNFFEKKEIHDILKVIRANQSKEEE